MNVEQLASPAIQELHKEIIGDLRELEDEIHDLTKRRDQMLAVVQNLEALYSGLSEYSQTLNGDGSPRGQEAVGRVLQENAGKWMAIKDIATEMRLRRWIDRDAKDPEAAVRAALRRFIDSEVAEIQQRRDGRSVSYRMVGENTAVWS